MQYNPNARAFNSTFRPISRKRAEAIANGTWKPKPRKPIRAVSKKTRHRIADYRAACFERWGQRCFLCGREMPMRMLDCHHIDGRTRGDNVERIVPLCNRFCGCHAHNHNGMDARFHELRAEIEMKMKGMENGKQPNKTL